MSAQLANLSCRRAIACAAALLCLLAGTAMAQTNAPVGLLNTEAALRNQAGETQRPAPQGQGGTNLLVSVIDTSVQPPVVASKEASGRFLAPKKSRYDGLAAQALKKPAPKSLLQTLNPFAPMPAVQAPREYTPWSARSGWQPMPSAALDPQVRENRGLLILSVGH
jgi:hypothetical protein